ncbi:hypothetical protein [Absidia glauca]|uniref:BZIP domain-containing protein n=1 Tax=Absidia glauca TaxID=4829 RepID=A0A163JZH9_ABSGL|nr:hypothetical protein [Absidia glauca]
MANKDNHSVIDWILQLDSPPSTTNSQPSPDTQQSTFPSVPSIPNDAGSTSVLTKSELFEFYLGDEVDQASKDVQQQQLQLHHAKRSAHHSDDDRQSITTSTTFTTTAKRTKKAKPTGAEPLSGRLDFRPTMTDQVPESQLKAMTPRERRQLRNKISARNFRNRRKEYMSTLEEELDDCKSENKKLHMELATIKGKMIQLETENKQLRLDLVLYEQGINPSSCQHHKHNNSSNSSSDTTTGALSVFELSPDTTLHTLPSDSSSASPPDLNTIYDPSYQPSSSALTQSHLLTPFYRQEQRQQPTPMDSLWNLPLPDFNLHDMYLSHAMMPDWDVDHVLSKSNEQSSLMPANINVMDTFQRFPLLAPALMSIVVGHTMTLSTNDLLTLNFSPPATTAPTTTAADKQILKIWELLQPLQQKKTITHSSVEDSNENDDTTDEDTSNSASSSSSPPSFADEKATSGGLVCSLHRYLKSYVCASVSAYLEHCRLEGEQARHPSL